MSYVYIYLNPYDKEEFLELFTKYNICGKDDKVARVIGKYTFFKNHYYIEKDAEVLKIEIIDQNTFELRAKVYSFGERIFRINQMEDIVLSKLIAKHDIRAKHYHDSVNSEVDAEAYKDYRYLQLNLYDALPFTDDEYSTIIHFVCDYDLEELKTELEDEAKGTFDKICKYEDFSIYPTAPEEPEYMERVENIFSILSTEAEDKVIYPEDESKYATNIDLKVIRKELNQAALDNSITLDFSSKGLAININCKRFKILEPLTDDGLSDMYNYVYDENNEIKIKIARYLRRIETGYLY